MGIYLCKGTIGGDYVVYYHMFGDEELKKEILRKMFIYNLLIPVCELTKLS